MLALRQRQIGPAKLHRRALSLPTLSSLFFSFKLKTKLFFFLASNSSTARNFQCEIITFHLFLSRFTQSNEHRLGLIIISSSGLQRSSIVFHQLAKRPRRFESNCLARLELHTSALVGEKKKMKNWRRISFESRYGMT